MGTRIKTEREWKAYNRAFDAAPLVRQGNKAGKYDAGEIAVQILRRSDAAKSQAKLNEQHLSREKGRTKQFAHKAKMSAAKKK